MMKSFSSLFVFLFLMSISLSAQTYVLQGKVTGTDGTALPGANVVVTKVNLGASTGKTGEYKISGVPQGSYVVRVSFVGYQTKSQTVTVTANKWLDFVLDPAVMQSSEVVIEVNRAKERETPVAFSNISGKEIEKSMHSQDAPLLIKTIPGVFAYSTDGVGNGESRLFVRGFDQNRVQVLINGIPTNDPESNSVYWSNWGAVSAAAASIQVQRGAGSSLYGSGSFGGSFNIVTSDANPNFGGEARVSFGSPTLFVGGASLRSGLLFNDLMSGSLSYDWKQGYGARVGSYYQGANYHMNINFFPDATSTLKFVLHAGPQEHSYSFNGPIAYFKKYGWDANPANFIPLDILDLKVGALTVRDSLNIDEEYRTIKDAKFLSLAHNFYHKPQFEVHYQKDLTENLAIRGTAFYSVGRGGGSSVNGASALTNAVFGADTNGNFLGTSAFRNLNAEDGSINPDQGGANFVVNRFLKSAYQRISYSLHRQFGFIASADVKLSPDLNLVVGGEYRDWFADHPGYFTNLYGKSSLSVMNYAYKRFNGTYTTFTRKTYQDDMKFGSGTADVYYANPLASYEMTTQNGTYNAQYRNYVGETKQGTGFVQGNYKIPDFGLNLVGSFQYVFYNYHLYENMPSESAIGDSVAAPASGAEGVNPDGMFYMKSSAATPTWYRFKLVDVTRSKGFVQPKFGATYNITPEISTFANFSYVQRMVDLSVFYNSGNPNPDAEDEKSTQIELGGSYIDENMLFKANVYQMSWENKTASIVDVSKAGQPGYDRNGQRFDLVGSSRNRGLELEGRIKLGMFHNMLNGLTVNVSGAFMDNKWTEVLESVKKDASGKRRAFDTGALTAEGKVDTLYFDELEGTVNASTPFTTFTYGLSYEYQNWFASLTAITAMNFYALDGASYIAVDGAYDAAGKFVPTYDNKLPNSTVIDLSAGYAYKLDPVTINVTGQVMNLFNTEFLVNANRSGVLPGLSRSFRLNLSVSY